MICNNLKNLPAIFAAAFTIVPLTGCFGAESESGDVQVEIVEAFPELSFSRSLWIGAAPDGSDNLFVLEQAGRVLWFENRSDVGQDDVNVALDLRDKVRSPFSEVEGNRGNNEEGLLGMAFHPDYEENGYVFLHYTETSPPDAAENQRGVVSRFEMDPRTFEIDRDSETVILTVDQFAWNHNGGMLAFGPDGYFYLSFGDGGGAGDPQKNGQNLGTLLGAILRIDVDNPDGDRPYSIPEDNPFVDREGARPEIFAYGLRNVWRFSFDPDHGDIWAGDVCQNNWEKIYLVQKGNNHGWPYLEGTHTFDGIPDDVDPDSLTPPIIEHPRDETRSITGGYIYRGPAVPELHDAYIYGDYVTGAIFALRYDRENEEVVEHRELGRAPEISSFGLDRDNRLYIVSLQGKIYRFADTENGTSPSDG